MVRGEWEEWEIEILETGMYELVIQGGNGAGMLTCLVLTGITTRELADNAPLHRKPAEIFDTL